MTLTGGVPVDRKKAVMAKMNYLHEVMQSSNQAASFVLVAS